MIDPTLAAGLERLIGQAPTPLLCELVAGLYRSAGDVARADDCSSAAPTLPSLRHQLVERWSRERSSHSLQADDDFPSPEATRVLFVADGLAREVPAVVTIDPTGGPSLDAIESTGDLLDWFLTRTAALLEAPVAADDPTDIAGTWLAAASFHLLDAVIHRSPHVVWPHRYHATFARTLALAWRRGPHALQAALTGAHDLWFADSGSSPMTPHEAFSAVAADIAADHATEGGPPGTWPSRGHFDSFLEVVSNAYDIPWVNSRGFQHLLACSDLWHVRAALHGCVSGGAVADVAALANRSWQADLEAEPPGMGTGLEADDLGPYRPGPHLLGGGSVPVRVPVLDVSDLTGELAELEPSFRCGRAALVGSAWRDTIGEPYVADLSLWPPDMDAYLGSPAAPRIGPRSRSVVAGIAERGGFQTPNGFDVSMRAPPPYRGHFAPHGPIGIIDVPGLLQLIADRAGEVVWFSLAAFFTPTGTQVRMFAAVHTSSLAASALQRSLTSPWFDVELVAHRDDPSTIAAVAHAHVNGEMPLRTTEMTGTDGRRRLIRWWRERDLGDPPACADAATIDFCRTFSRPGDPPGAPLLRFGLGAVAAWAAGNWHPPEGDDVVLFAVDRWAAGDHYP